MRADRLVSIVLLLRRRGQMTATALATELEVSTRTVLRDIEALSGAGVPVYAERGRRGGFALLPGFHTELTGLNHDEALAVLAATGDSAGRTLGLGPAFASALRKIVDALPDDVRATADAAATHLLVEPDETLLPRRTPPATATAPLVHTVRRAVLAGTRLRFRYAAPEQSPSWRTVDPLGLVTVGERAYLVARRGEADRTYRLDRMLAAEALDEPAQRPAQTDLGELWHRRCAEFLATDHLTAVVVVDPSRRDELAASAVAVRHLDTVAGDRSIRLEVTFQDLRHGEWALWQLGPEAEAVSPPALRAALAQRAHALAARYPA